MTASLACGGETPAAVRGGAGAGWPGCGGGEAQAERRQQRARPSVAGCGGGGAVAETIHLAGLAGLRRNG